MDFKAVGVSEKSARVISNIVRTQLIKMDTCIVVERTQMDAIMQEQGLQMSGCTDESCAIKVGRLMSANRILIGEVGSMGKTIIVTVRIIDVEKGISKLAEQARAPSLDKIDNPLNELAQNLGKRIINKYPESPSGLTLVRKEKGGNTLNIFLKWLPAKDPDGTVERYHVFRKTDEGYTKIGDTVSTQYTAAGLNPVMTHFFRIKSQDDSGDLSDFSSSIRSKLDLDVTAQGSYIIPMGDFADLLSPGWGALLNLSFRDIFIYDLDCGLLAGYYSFTGETDVVDKSYIIPLMLSIGYRFNFLPFLSISPRIAGGYCYNSITYDKDGKAWDDLEYSTEGSFEPMAMAGLMFTSVLGNSFVLHLGADYGMIFESGGTMNFVSVHAALGMRIGL